MLKGIPYKDFYFSIEDNFDEDFLIPSYYGSILHERGSGFFSLSSLVLSFRGLLKFIENGGEIHLICSPRLDAQDVALITASLNDSVVTEHILKLVKEEYEDIDVKKMDVICNMIAEHRLIIKIAYMPDGLYHEKFGIFTDEEGNKVFYSGSNNETLSAKVKNYESFTTSQAWESAKEKRIVSHWSEHFEKLWNNDQPGLQVMDFPDALRKDLFDEFKKSGSLQEAIDSYTAETEGKKRLYPFQRKAIDEFFKNGCCHFFEMATGTGKTFTTVKLIEEFCQKIEGKLFTMICVPQIDLQVQWKRALEAEGFDDLILLGGINSGNTEDAISDAVIRGCMGKEHVVCVAVYDTFFAKVYNRVSNIKNLFVVVDEAHNLTANYLAKLPKKLKHRLGLSATIQRFSDQETKDIIEFFTRGSTVPYYYGIEDAIENGFLSHYMYYPVTVRMNEEEFELYQKKTLALATELNKDIFERDEEAISKLRTERSLIVKKTASKLDKLEEMTKGDYEFKNSVVYCGQGKDRDSDTPIIDNVTRILSDAGLEVSTFTSKTESRPKVLDSFESGYYDTLVAIRCFDEGVDVPKLDKIYIMASDGQLRQTVQRRGRVLRVCKETGKTIAYIYDMIVLPVQGRLSDMGVNSLIVNEFRRVMEYGRLADNKTEVESFTQEYLDLYNITEEDFNNDED